MDHVKDTFKKMNPQEWFKGGQIGGCPQDYCKILLILVVVCAISCYIKMYCKRKEYFTNTPSSDNRKIKLVYYSKNGCPYCIRFDPIWVAFTTNTLSRPEFYHVSFEKTIHQDDPTRASNNGVQGFPTIMAHMEDGSKIKYRGERTVNALRSWVMGLTE